MDLSIAAHEQFSVVLIIIQLKLFDGAESIRTAICLLLFDSVLIESP